MLPSTAEKTAPKLFISYSHDSQEHEDRVRVFADRLRRDGVDALIDQYHTAPPDGWPLWMDDEIQKADFVAVVCTETYLRRVERRELEGKGRGVLWEAKLIFNHLYTVDTDYQRFIPILMNGQVPSFIPRPLQGFAHYEVDKAEGYEDFYRHLTRQPRHERPDLGILRSVPILEPQSYPASLEISTKQKAVTSIDRRNRLQMLRRVRLDWIEGVLMQSLYKIVRVEVGLQAKSDAIEQPWKAIVRSPAHPEAAISAGTKISRIFDDNACALLVLGAPGTGKTTLLLELAKELLDRAEKDENCPMPVVFNLSSWAVQRGSLNRWIVSELNERSDVPKRLAEYWVESEQIIPLLDGLDEVAAEHRLACAEAINKFRREHGLLPIAVCSRIADYEALGTKLRLRSAVVVQPLTKSEIENYLEQIGEPARAIRLDLARDPSLWELLETPLMLWVAILAYRDTSVEFSEGDALDRRRRRLFAKFVDSMFKRDSSVPRYSRGESISWLSWLAASMKRKEQTVFYLENLSESWLSTRAQGWLLRAWAIVGSALAIGSIYWVGRKFFGNTSGVLKSGDGLTLGLVFGLIFGLVGTIVGLRPIEKMRISLSNMSFRLPRAARVGLHVGAAFGLIFGAYVGFSNGLLDGLLSALRFTLLYGLGFGLVTLFFGEAVETRRTPNQGTLRSAKMALFVGLLTGLIVALIDGLIQWCFHGQGDPMLRLRVAVSTGLHHGLEIGPIYGIISGGLFALRHLVSRLILWVKKSAPLRYVQFLDYSVERLFLRKVGGGFIFMHRTLLEYFASLQKQPNLD